MTQQEKLTFIRAKCIEANPGKIWVYQEVVESEAMGDTCGLIETEAEARLADVLLAAREVSERIEGQLFVSDNGMFCIAKVGKSLDGLGYWNLRKDDLNEQEPATIDFIYDLLK